MQWIATAFSLEISLNSTWSEREKEACKKLKFKPSEEQLKAGYKKYFVNTEKAEYYWSMVIMCRNVNESLREAEISTSEKGGNENTSYASKIKNAQELRKVYEILNTLRLEVFRGNDEAEKVFREEKQNQESSGTFLDQRRKGK